MILKVFVKLNDSMILCLICLLFCSLAAGLGHHRHISPLRWAFFFLSLGSGAPLKYCLSWWVSVRPVTMGSVVRPLTMILKCRITAPVESVCCLYRPGLRLNRVGRRYYRSCIKNCLLLPGLNRLLGGQKLHCQGNVTFAFFSLLHLAPRGKSCGFCSWRLVF